MLLMAGGLLASCSSDELSSVPVPDGTDKSKVYMLCIETQKGGGASQRALAEDGEYIRSTWATTDKVYVKKGDSWFYGELQPQSDGASTTLRGVIAGLDIVAGDVLTLQYLKKGDMTYDGQIGTLADISENFDYATAEVTVSSVDSEGNVYLTESSANFKNQQAILKLILKDGDGNNFNASQLTVYSDGKKCTVTPASATNVMYVAVPCGTDNVRFLASNSNHRYYGDIPSQHKGFFKTITLDMKECGLFSVANDRKVKFSKGNMQATWNGTKWTWAFAEHQWDYVGAAPGNTAVNGNGTVSTSNVTVDLFGWVGASNTTWSGPNGSGSTGEAAMHGISNSSEITSTSGYGNSTNDALKSDWGNVRITNGEGYTWRSLTSAEWRYLFKIRNSGTILNAYTSALYTFATINTDGTSIKGIILFPDGIKIANSDATWGSINALSSYATKCTTAQWLFLEDMGCVFLPASGFRTGAVVYAAGNNGLYWSSSSDGTSGGEGGALSFEFRSNDLEFDYYYNRSVGFSVRLVREVP